MIDYLAPYKLLKEARESWDYFVSDEVVYALQYGDVIIGRGQGGYLDAYLEGHVWVEFFCFPLFVCSGHSYAWVAIMERVMDGGWPLNAKPRSALWLNDKSVLRAIGEFPQDSQEIRFRPIRSVIRLKAFDVRYTARENIRKLSTQLIAESPPDITWVIADRKLCIGAGFTSVSQILHRQLPSNVIQTGSQTIGDLTNDRTPSIGNGAGPSEVYLPAILLDSHSQGFVFIPGNPSLQGIETFFRPSTLEPSMIQRMGNWNHE